MTTETKDPISDEEIEKAAQEELCLSPYDQDATEFEVWCFFKGARWMQSQLMARWPSDVKQFRNIGEDPVSDWGKGYDRGVRDFYTWLRTRLFGKEK